MRRYRCVAAIPEPMLTISAFHFALRNEGRGPARYPTVMLNVNHGGSQTTRKDLGPYTRKYRNETVECSVGIDRIAYRDTRIFGDC